MGEFRNDVIINLVEVEDQVSTGLLYIVLLTLGFALGTNSYLCMTQYLLLGTGSLPQPQIGKVKPTKIYHTQPYLHSFPSSGIILRYIVLYCEQSHFVRLMASAHCWIRRLSNSFLFSLSSFFSFYYLSILPQTLTISRGTIRADLVPRHSSNRPYNTPLQVE